MKPEEDPVFPPERTLGNGVEVMADEVVNGEYGLVINGRSLVRHQGFLSDLYWGDGGGGTVIRVKGKKDAKKTCALTLDCMSLDLNSWFINVSQRTFTTWFSEAPFLVPHRTFQTRVL